VTGLMLRAARFGISCGTTATVAVLRRALRPLIPTEIVELPADFDEQLKIVIEEAAGLIFYSTDTPQEEAA
jgi:hypothetical protein